MSLNNFVKNIQNIMRGDGGVDGDAQRIAQMTWIIFLKIYGSKEENWQFLDPDYQSIIPDKLQWANWAVDNKDGKALTGEALLDFVNNQLLPTLKNLPIDNDTPIKQSIVKDMFEDANNYMKNGVLLRKVINVIDEIDFDEYDEKHAFGEIYETILKSLQSAGNAGEFYTPRAVTDFMVQMLQPKIGERIGDFACGTGGFLTSAIKVLNSQVTDIEERQQFNKSIYGIEKKPLPHMLCVTNMLLHDIDNPHIIHGNGLEDNVREYKDSDKFDVILLNPPYGGTEDEGIKNNFPKDLQSSETADLFMSVVMYRLKDTLQGGGRAGVIIPDGFLFGDDSAKTAIKKKLIQDFNLHTIIRLPASVFSPYTSITTNILFFDNYQKTQDIWFYRVDMPSTQKHFSKTKPMKLEHFNDCIAWWNDRQSIKDSDTDSYKAQKYTADELIKIVADDNGADSCTINLDLCGYPTFEEEVLSPSETMKHFIAKRTALNNSIDATLARINALLKGETLLTEIETLDNAEQELKLLQTNFPKKLKSSLLQSAIKGELTEQLDSDGNASDLLAEIEAEKAQLIKDKKIKKSKSLPPISDDEIPFDIPKNWVWVRLNDVGIWGSGATPKRSNPKFYQNGTINWLKTGDLTDGFIETTSEKITQLALENSSVKLNPIGSVLIAMYGATIGKLGILKIPATTNQACCACSPFNNIVNKYLFYFLLANRDNFIKMGAGGAQPNISKEKIINTLIPLPPLAEQQRIVEKLDTLLAEVERL